MSRITSLQNPAVQAARRLTRRAFRERERKFLIEGPHALEDAFDAGATITDVFVSSDGPSDSVARAAAAGVRVHEVSEQALRAISDATTPQGIVAIADLPEATLGKLDLSSGLIVVLAEIRDPGNAGTLIRSASAAAAGGIVFATGSVDPYGPKTLRAAAGSVFRIPLVAKVDLDEALEFLSSQGFELVGADARSDTSIYDVDLTRPAAIVLGNEAWGLPDQSKLDVTAGIPMPGDVESLNVSVAGSLFLFEASRQRSRKAAG